MKNIQVDADVFARLQALAEPGESPADVLRRRVAGHVIEIDDDTYAALLALAESFGESASEVVRRVLQIDSPPEPDPDQPATVEFHIPHGTGSGPWNVEETAVHAFVGDTFGSSTTTTSTIGCTRMPPVRSRIRRPRSHLGSRRTSR